MASSKVCLLAALCSLVILTSFIGSTQSASCCLMYSSRKISCQRMLAYTIQTITNSCDIDAIIFHLPGIFVCANPSAKWAQKAMKCLDERRTRSSPITAKKNITSA